MATRTISNAGGNASATTTWVEGVVPVDGDDVVATATSGNLVWNITARIRSLNLTNYTGTFSGTTGIDIGSSTLPPNGSALIFRGTITYTGQIQLRSTAEGEHTLDFNNASLTTQTLVIVGGTNTVYKLAVPFVSVDTLNMTSGTFDTNNKSFIFKTISRTGSVAATLKLGSSVLETSATTSGAISFTNGVALEANTAKIICRYGQTISAPDGFNTNGLTIIHKASQTLNINNSITIKTLIIDQPANTTMNITAGKTLTITDEFICIPKAGLLTLSGGAISKASGTVELYGVVTGTTVFTGGAIWKARNYCQLTGTAATGFSEFKGMWYADLYNGDDALYSNYGWWRVDYTNASGARPTEDMVVTGNTSGATAKLLKPINGYDWDNGAGTLYFYGKTGTFQAETVTLANGATMQIAGDFLTGAAKTLKNGVSSNKVSQGDDVLIIKTPPPASIGNATWTDLSKTITLAAARTQLVDNCETAWTAANSATVTRQPVATDAKEGSYCMQITAPASPATNTKYAVFATGLLDLSTYQRLTFWFKNEVATAAGNWKICLCSDTAGNTIVDSFLIEAIPSPAQWLPLTISKDGAGNLGASIQSIAIYSGTVAPTASKYVRLDNINACKTDDLNLQSLITKDGSEITGADGFYCLQSINGTTLMIDSHSTTKSNEGRGYTGATETVATYRRESFKTALVATAGTVVEQVNDSGIEAWPINYKFGCNPATNTQDGETVLDGLNCYGTGLSLNSKNDVTTTNVSAVRFEYGFYFSYGIRAHTNKIASSGCNTGIRTSSCSKSTHTLIRFSLAAKSQNFQIDSSTFLVFDRIYNASGSLGYGININSSFCKFNRVDKASNNKTTGVYISASQGNIFKSIGEIRKNDSWGLELVSSTTSNKIEAVETISYNGYGIRFSSAERNIVANFETANNVSAAIAQDSVFQNFLLNAKINEATETYLTVANTYCKLNSHNHDRQVGNHLIFVQYGLIRYVVGGGFTAELGRWEINPTNAARDINWPIVHDAYVKVYCKAGVQKTVNCKVKLSHATDIGAALRIDAVKSEGIATDIVATAAETTEWQNLMIAFTPTVDGVVIIDAIAYWRANTADEVAYFSKPITIF